MRRTVRLVLALCALAALAAPTALAAERMWVGFHDDPSFRWANGRTAACAGIRRRRRGDHAPARAVEPRGAAAADHRVRPVRPRLPVRRPRRGAPRGPACGHGGHAHHLGDAGLGERRQERERDAEPGLATSGTSPAPSSSRYYGRNDGYPFVRFWSVWNEPNLTAIPDAAVRLRGQVGRPGQLREAVRRRVAGIKAGNPIAKVAIGETSRARERQAAGPSADALPGQASQSSSRRRTRGSSSTRGRTTRIRSTRPRRRARS